MSDYARLSIPGNECVHCGAVIGASLECPGCGWLDPLTKHPLPAQGVSQPERTGDADG